MCWCDSTRAATFCGEGPCNEEEITSFQNIVREFMPTVSDETLHAITKVHANDLPAWLAHQQISKMAQQIAESSRNWFEKMLVASIKPEFLKLPK